MPGWVAQGEIVGREVGEVWVDQNGCVSDAPVTGAETLPGRFVLAGLVDAHAHPAMTASEQGPLPRDLATTIGELEGWGARGVTFVRDTGSPGGISLEVPSAPGRPRLDAAGRFLAPPGRYFPGVYEGTPAEQLVAAVIAEIGRGARWIKIVGDFFNDQQPPVTPTYDAATIAAACTAAHEHGARVAVHATLDTVGEIVDAGADTIEHGLRLDEATLDRMRARGTAWVPTLGALLAAADAPHVAGERRAELAELRDRIFAALRYADRIGVPILTGSDVTGTVPGEVALLARAGLAPDRALAAATTAGYALLELDPWRTGTAANLVTYDADPREDPAVLEAPVAIVLSGARVR